MFPERLQTQETLIVWASASLMSKTMNSFVYHDSPLLKSESEAK